MLQTQRERQAKCKPGRLFPGAGIKGRVLFVRSTALISVRFSKALGAITLIFRLLSSRCL